MKLLLSAVILMSGAAYGAAMPFRKLKLIGEQKNAFIVSDAKNQKMTLHKQSVDKSEVLKLKKNYGKLVSVRVLPNSLKKMKAASK